MFEPGAAGGVPMGGAPVPSKIGIPSVLKLFMSLHAVQLNPNGCWTSVGIPLTDCIGLA